jgi:hypothetical protein
MTSSTSPEKPITAEVSAKAVRSERKALRYSSIVLLCLLFACVVLVRDLRVSAKAAVPRVQLHAEDLGPRQIEDLTSKSIARDYALAWQTMEQALEENRPGLLDGYFTGLAKQDLNQRVRSQIKSGLHTRYQDNGHKLEAIFYSPGGDVMELRDHAKLDIEVRDGSKVIYQGPVSLEYMVIMTPGADRWLVRDLQASNGVKP